jgi:N-dimethylarginine dimethylaminohydrolase
MRFNVENALLAVNALEEQLEHDLEKLKTALSEKEFLTLMQRCLNLRKQALIACLQAAQRGKNE